MSTPLPILGARGLSNNKPAIKTLNNETSIESFKKNNEEVVEEVNEETTTTTNPVATTTRSIVDEISSSTRKKRKRITVSMNEDVFEKLITAANGKSVSKVMEGILSDAVANEHIDRDIVEKYKDTMKDKGCKSK